MAFQLAKTLGFPEDYAKDVDLLASIKDTRRPETKTIYAEYCNRCFKSGAMDFDDLLLKTCDIESISGGFI